MIQPPVCLTIAGSDPSGGAGIQGDLKTFAAHEVYGMAVVTALTAQNTKDVAGVMGVDPAFVNLQLQSIYDDIPTDYIKTGMLLNAPIINAIGEFFKDRRSAQLVVDPVMISSSGSKLITDDAILAYVDKMFPIAELLTPNNLETRHFSGLTIASVDESIEASMVLRRLGARNVLVKGGDTTFRDSPDVIFDVLNADGKVYVFERTIYGSPNSHGTGCALAASICAYLAKGISLPEAVNRAGQYVGGALKHSYKTGQGSGAINHLWNISPREPEDFR